MVTHHGGRPCGPDVVSTRQALRTARAALPSPTAVVMTMGALHDGHGALLAAARADAKSVIATIFVNPIQFGPAEDFERYPRTLDADRDLCEASGVDLIFAPSVAEMYPEGQPSVLVDPGPIGGVLEGASRAGHFAGVLTVVLKLLNLTRPDAAYFGEKDFQQLAAIRAMVVDFDLPIEIVGVPTVREPDGLARSSRNRYLSASDRVEALALPKALAAGAAAAGGGAVAAVEAASAVLRMARAIDVDYVALTDDLLRPVADGRKGPARLLVAARVGGTRLIDNMAVEIG